MPRNQAFTTPGQVNPRNKTPIPSVNTVVFIAIDGASPGDDDVRSSAMSNGSAQIALLPRPPRGGDGDGEGYRRRVEIVVRADAGADDRSRTRRRRDATATTRGVESHRAAAAAAAIVADVVGAVERKADIADVRASEE